jgi:SAM-dependent methyltransferase
VKLDDPALVREEYASESRLAARKAAYRFAVGPDPRDVAFDAIAEIEPKRVLEVGCGEGELAERVSRELACQILALDQSERMVELTRARMVDAIVGDVQDLQFGDGEFDCVVAAWMLYHVPEIERALGELARVLRAGGRLVAVTNTPEHLRELKNLLDVERDFPSFWGDNGEELLRGHFAKIERRETPGSINFPDRAAAQAYVDASVVLFGGRQLPSIKGPLSVCRGSVVFVAEKA